MSVSDIVLLTATVFSGLMGLGYAIFRHDAGEEKRKVVKFWLEVFTMCAVLAAIRLFYSAFPAVPPDSFFFGCTVLCGGIYVYFKITRRHDTAERRKVIKVYRDACLILLAVFLFRGFLFDWFRIPSSSMLPTLTTGDLVLTDKNRYGYRLPLFNTRLTPGVPPARGDIIVFKKPGESLFYIKRIVGLPGDTVRYGDDKSLTINGNAAEFALQDDGDSGGGGDAPRRLRERLDGGWHDILLAAGSNVLFYPPHPDACRLNQSVIGYILTCEVPEGNYFVLGDNRDHSNDSRFWGFVPEENIVGPAVSVMFNHRLITALEWRQKDRLWLPLALERE